MAIYLSLRLSSRNLSIQCLAVIGGGSEYGAVLVLVILTYLHLSNTKIVISSSTFTLVDQ